MQKENNLPTNGTDDSVVVYHDYFSSLTENVIGTDDPDEYNPNGEASKVIAYNSVYECINKDIESIYKDDRYKYNSNIFNEARKLSSTINTDRFIHILADSLASLGISIKNTIEYFYNIDTGVIFPQSFTTIGPNITMDLYSPILELIVSTTTDSQYIVDKIILAVDRFVAELYNETHANILIMCASNFISDTEKGKIFNIIYPIFVVYHDSLIRSILLYMTQSMELNAFTDYLKLND